MGYWDDVDAKNRCERLEAENAKLREQLKAACIFATNATRKYERLRDAWRHRFTYSTDVELHAKRCAMMNRTIQRIEAEGE